MTNESDAPVTRPDLDALIAELHRELNLLIEEAVAAERERQITIGYDQKHDDAHGLDHLWGWAQHYRAKGEFIKSLALFRAFDESQKRRVVAIGSGTR